MGSDAAFQKASAQAVADALTADGFDKTTFAKKVAQTLAGVTPTKESTENKVTGTDGKKTTTNYTIAGLDDGYYVVFNRDNATVNGDAMTAAILCVVTKVNVSPK